MFNSRNFYREIHGLRFFKPEMNESSRSSITFDIKACISSAKMCGRRAVRVVVANILGTIENGPYPQSGVTLKVSTCLSNVWLFNARDACEARASAFAMRMRYEFWVRNIFFGMVFNGFQGYVIFNRIEVITMKLLERSAWSVTSELLECFLAAPVAGIASGHSSEVLPPVTEEDGPGARSVSCRDPKLTVNTSRNTL